METCVVEVPALALIVAGAVITKPAAVMVTGIVKVFRERSAFAVRVMS